MTTPIVEKAIETPLCYLSHVPMALPTLVICEGMQRYCDYGVLALWTAQHKGCPNCFGQDHRFNLMHLQPDDALIPRIQQAVQRTFPNKSFDVYKFEKFLEQFSNLSQTQKQSYSTKRVLRHLLTAICYEIQLHPEVFLSSPYKWDVIQYCFAENHEDKILTFIDHLLEEITEEDFRKLVGIIFGFSKSPSLYVLSILSMHRAKVSGFGSIWSWVITKFIEQQNHQVARKILSRFSGFYQSSTSIDRAEIEKFEEQLDALQKKEEKELLMAFARLCETHKGDALEFWKKHNLHRFFELHRKGQLEEYFEGTKKS